MHRVTYINANGESVVFGQQRPFILSKIEGLGDIDANLQSQKSPNQDGDTHISTLLEPRFIEMEITILSEDAEEHRRQLARIMNPKIAGTLIYENGQIKREINGINEHIPKFPADLRSHNHQLALVNIKCPNPYWKDTTTTAEELTTFSGGLTFPLQLPTIFGNQDSNAKSRIIVNEGDSPTPIEVTFEGPATSPIRIENETTGEFIEVQQDLLEGEKLWICTAFGRKRVEKIQADGTRINAFHYIYIDPSNENPSSTFFQLQPGNNLITYSTGEEYETAPVTIRFQSQYVAV